MDTFEYTTVNPLIETWKPVPAYETHYEVSNFGHVRRSAPGKGTYVGRILKTPPDTDGYPRVRLSKDGKQRDVNIHILVAAAFIGQCPVGYEVNHIDHNRANCCMDNLEYLTHAQNMLESAKRRRYLGREPAFA